MPRHSRPEIRLEIGRAIGAIGAVDPTDLFLLAGKHSVVAGEVVPTSDRPSSGLIVLGENTEIYDLELHELKGTDKYYVVLVLQSILKVRRVGVRSVYH
jgi:hypothetical protein